MPLCSCAPSHSKEIDPYIHTDTQNVYVYVSVLVIKQGSKGRSKGGGSVYFLFEEKKGWERVKGNLNEGDGGKEQSTLSSVSNHISSFNFILSTYSQYMY